MTAIFALLCITLLAQPSAGAWRPIGAIIAVPPSENQITFHNAHNIVSVTVPAPGLVRVRMAPQAQFGPDYSWAVIKKNWPKAAADFFGTGKTRDPHRKADSAHPACSISHRLLMTQPVG